MTDPYQVLDLPTSADEAAIRKRYLELVKQYPPDRAPEKFAAIRAAYEALRNRDQRLSRQLFEVDHKTTLQTVVEEIACQAPRRRVSLAQLLTMLESN
jgi:curved DNA-binding protein CbpA